MKLFIDSAILSEIQEVYDFGIIDGVTTNPSLLHKAKEAMEGKVDLAGYLKKILETAKGTPVSLEVTETSEAKMVSEGKKLFKRFNPVANNVWIKIPVHTSVQEGQANTDGIRAIKQLAEVGIPVNCTLVFTPEQALLAAKAGATVVSPFAGRIDDYIRTNHDVEFKKSDYYPAMGWQDNQHTLEDNGIVSGVELVKQCKRLLDSYGLRTGVLAASLRNPRQVREAALVGADIATIPYPVITELLKHPKTVEGMKAFMKDVVPEYKKL
ncbi:transaldolase [Candidatus Woesearchaeota archaeon]|nr:transaldolase [Candidatus Woesearchaeota archaeon]